MQIAKFFLIGSLLTVIAGGVIKVIAEYQFSDGVELLTTCRAIPSNCYHAAVKMNRAIELNRSEFIYKKYISNALIKYYTHKKDLGVLRVAYRWCKESYKYSWDRHYPYMCEGTVLMLKGDKKQALEKFKKAQKIIPYNTKLKAVIFQISQGMREASSSLQ